MTKCKLAVIVLSVTLLVTGLVLARTMSLLAEKSYYLTETIKSFSEQVNHYDAHCTYLEHFIETHVPGVVWSENPEIVH